MLPNHFISRKLFKKPSKADLVFLKTKWQPWKERRKKRDRERRTWFFDCFEIDFDVVQSCIHDDGHDLAGQFGWLSHGIISRQNLIFLKQTKIKK
jgi:hypothetical protein